MLRDRRLFYNLKLHELKYNHSFLFLLNTMIFLATMLIQDYFKTYIFVQIKSIKSYC